MVEFVCPDYWMFYKVDQNKFYILLHVFSAKLHVGKGWKNTFLRTFLFKWYQTTKQTNKNKVALLMLTKTQRYFIDVVLDQSVKIATF